MSTSIFKKLVRAMFPLVAVGSGVIAGGCSVELADENVGSAEQALTPEQCTYFDVNGMVQICHKLGNGKYKIVRVNENACINAFSSFPNDYVTSTDPGSPLYDPTCQGLGCLPVAAPCDASLPCGDGSACINGTCNATQTDPCDPNPCVNGGLCDPDGNNSFMCSCPAGWTGPTCSEAIEVGYDCSGNNPCTQENIDANQLFFAASSGPENFIQCDTFGGCYVMSCAPGAAWNQSLQTCTF